MSDLNLFIAHTIYVMVKNGYSLMDQELTIKNSKKKESFLVSKLLLL